MKVFKIVFSPTGGTNNIANAIAEGLGSEITKIDLTNSKLDFASIQIQPEDVCLMAVPVYGGRAPQPAIDHISLLHGNGAKTILVAVYGNRAFDDTLVELKDTALAAGFQPVAAIAAVAEHSILRQYGQGRPDKRDLRDLARFTDQIKEVLAKDEVKDLPVPGIRPYKERAILPTMPIAGESCGSCGYCANVCPTGAIPKEQPNQTINDLCISCMRCTFVCPNEARYVRPNVANILNEKLAKHATQRKGNQLFI